VAYDPILTSFIAVSVVGGVAMVMNVSADWGVTHELAQATENWTAALVSRRYERSGSLFERRRKEASILQAHGYTPAYERGDAVPAGPETAAVTGSPVTGEPVGTSVLVIYQRI
jgi:hypothetical protein